MEAIQNNLSVFAYQGEQISFQRGNCIMVNATEMAKPFKKQPSDWLRLKQTNEFINAIASVRGIPRTALIQAVRGGNGEQGTWFHEDVAIEYARWLNPQIAIWCNDRIKELMRYGMTATPQTIDNILADL